MRIYVAIPAYHRQIDVEILFGITELQGRFEVELDTAICSLIHEARNALVKRFLASSADWLYFWDADVVIRDPHIFTKLIETSEKLDAQIVGAAYRWKNETGWVTAGDLSEDGKILNKREIDLDEPVIVDAVGTGSMLIRRDVLTTIPAPWFEHKTTADHSWSEDYLFCLKAKELGFKIALETRVETRHYGLQFWPHLPKKASSRTPE